MFSIIGGDGKEYGPVSADQLRAWMAENRVTLQTQARRVGTETWAPLGSFPEFGGAAPDPANPPPPNFPAVPLQRISGDTTSAGPTAATATPGQPERFVFTGEWAEYFKIWIVNVLLTILTLGIYAAWAKVRKRRYFAANTRVLGHTFEYLADPKKILIGNLIVVGLFALYAFSGAISPLIQLPVMLAFAIAFPWFVVRALTFNARNTAWRGLRFNFTGTYGEAAAVFLGWPLLVPFTLGLIFPLVAKKQKEFLFNRSAFGIAPFNLTVTTGDFYRIYGIAFLFFLPLVAAYFWLIFSVAIAAARSGGQQPPDPAIFATFLPFLFIGIPLAIVGTFYFRSRMFNLLWNNTTLEGNRFIATMRARDLFVLQLVNSLVTLVTFGLMHPWAAVRTAKFQLDQLQVVPAGNIDSFIAAAHVPGSAIGEAASDFFDFDIGFGL